MEMHTFMIILFTIFVTLAVEGIIQRRNQAKAEHRWYSTHAARAKYYYDLEVKRLAEEASTSH